MTKFSLKSLLWTFFFATLIPFSGCINDNEPTPEPEPYALVSLFNAIPDSTALEIYLDSAKASSSDFTYNEHFAYSPVPTGNHTFYFKILKTSDTLISVSHDFGEQKAYSLFVAGTSSDPHTLIVEDVGPALVGDKSLIRVVNLSPDTSPIRVEVEGMDTPLVSSLASGQISSFIAVDAAHGTKFSVKTADGQITLKTAESVDLFTQKVYTLVVKGFSNPPEGNTNGITMSFLPNN